MKTAKQHNSEQGVGESEKLSNAAHVSCPNAELVIENYCVKEPRTGLSTGVWFSGDQAESVWSYRGTLSVVIQFAKIQPDSHEPMVVSKCPPCERRALMDKFPSRKVKRWLVLPQ